MFRLMMPQNKQLKQSQEQIRIEHCSITLSRCWDLLNHTPLISDRRKDTRFSVFSG
jgi:hypothetical protein